jgi:5-methylcytosine-specific restriction protein A
MKYDKVLMFKLNSGRYILEHGDNSGWEKYNLIPHSNGNFYGMILNRGRDKNISLERIDVKVNKNINKIENVMLIYFEDFHNATNIVAIAENTTIFRESQKTEETLDERSGIAYHTITKPENMTILDNEYIPINIPLECNSFFGAQRAFFKGGQYSELETQIVDEVYKYLNNDEQELQHEQIMNSEIPSNKNSSIDDLSYCFNGNRKQISKKPWVSKNALHKANYKCEFDCEHKTFITGRGLQYMEGHHLIRCTVRISMEIWDDYKRNIDTESNIVSLCPNCHRQIHLGNKKEKLKIIEVLYNKRYKELEKDGIFITLDRLKAIYGI